MMKSCCRRVASPASAYRNSRQPSLRRTLEVNGVGALWTMARPCCPSKDSDPTQSWTCPLASSWQRGPWYQCSPEPHGLHQFRHEVNHGKRTDNPRCPSAQLRGPGRSYKRFSQSTLPWNRYIDRLGRQGTAYRSTSRKRLRRSQATYQAIVPVLVWSCPTPMTLQSITRHARVLERLPCARGVH